VSYVKSDEDGDLGTADDQVITYYSYDPHGNVEWLVQSIPGLYGGGSQEGIAIDYDYDLMSGKVRKVVMQKGRYDQSMHRYDYDYDGRLTKVETSRDGWIWDRDASYSYYAHGPLKRMELGHDLIQGIDYAYTINGWLKGVNTPKLDVAYDMGGDGYSSSANKRYGRDVFGMFLRYHDQDFKHTGSVLDQSGAISSWHQSGGDLFNGNISAWSLNTRSSSGTSDAAIGSRYHYDVLNRIRTDSTQIRYGGAWSTPSMLFGSTYTYDGNGNIKTLSRNEASGGFDNLEYYYITGTNKLSYITDHIASEYVAGDLTSNGAGNYAYDATGNLTQDTSEHIGANGIVWTPMNKIRSITKSGSAQKIEYLYDAMGNRVRKQVYEPSTTLKSTTWYVRDPKGTVMATYTKTGSDTLRLTEIPIYGSERIGMMTPNVAYKSAGIDTMDATCTRTLGQRLYELKDHLGNVRATVSDLLIDHSGSKDAELIASTDYYPFGMIIPGRSYKASGSTAYRYGFNGKENDNEVKGEGDQQDYGFRIYDPRLARFLSVDPLVREYPELTPYQFASNTPIWAIDLDGLEAYYIHGTSSSSDRWMLNGGLSEGGRQLFRLTNNKSWNATFNWGHGLLNVGNGPFNDRIDRGDAARELVDHIMSTRTGNEDVTLIGHSHGGNVAVQAAKMLRTALDDAGSKETKIRLITVNTPADNSSDSPENPESMLRSGVIASHVHLYNDLDGVQTGLSTFVTAGITQFDSEYSNPMTKNHQLQLRPLFQTGSYRVFGGGSAPIYSSDFYQIETHSADRSEPNTLKKAIDSGQITKPE